MTASRPSSGAWAVVPVKRLEVAKLRMAPALSPAQREELARAMLDDVLGTLARVRGLGGMLVVTADPWAADLARCFGAEIVHDAAEAGTDAAVAQGLRRLAGEERGIVLVVPADVPFATEAELGAVLCAMQDARAVLVPAAGDGGTNLLAMSRPDLFRTEFGPGSFARHLAAARRKGIEPRALSLRGVARDLDRPSDLVLDGTEDRSTRTAAFLAELVTQPRPRRPASLVPEARP